MPSAEAAVITIDVGEVYKDLKDAMDRYRHLAKDFETGLSHAIWSPITPDSYLEVEFTDDEKDVLELLLEREQSSLSALMWIAVHNLVSEGLVVEVDDGYSEWGVPPVEEFRLTLLGKTLMENYKTYGKFIFFLADS